MSARFKKNDEAPLVTVDRVSMTYGSGAAAVQAVRDVCLEVRRGEIVLLMGPSGSGKTTLLQILGGLLHPTEGSVIFDDTCLGDLDDALLCELRLRRFGFIFQSYNLFPTLRAWENIAIACELQGARNRQAEERGRELLDYVGLTDRADAYPETLSGGQKQRIAIARAIAGDPDLVLADEPTAALDAASGLRIGVLLRDLAHRLGRAVVVVTHDPRLMRIGDRIIVLEDGRILSSEDEPRGSRPAPLTTAGLLI